MGDPAKPEILEYYDHKSYLRDMYTAVKKVKPSFSYRYIAKSAGFSSPSFFLKVLEGTNQLNMNTILRLAEIFKLSEKDKEYFELLVLYNQAQSHQEKKYFLEKIAAIKRIRVKSMDPYQFDFFNNWYNVAILELLDFITYNGDNKELASLVDPPIKVSEAKGAITLLEKLGLIRKNDDGSFEKTNATLSTGYEARSVAIQQFQIETMELAKQAIDRHKKESREIATLTLSVSDDLMDRIKDKLKYVRRQILEMARMDENSQRVYQINFQVFPLSKKYKGDRGK
jgi:uncharacterized protein (TIGR02147 family)